MEKSPNKLSTPVVALIAAVAAALITFGVMTLTSSPEQAQTVPAQEQASTIPATSTDTTYTVPYVVSLTQSDAEKAIYASGLQVGDVSVQASDEVPAGNVISQDPEGLTAVDANSKVNLVISSGSAAPKQVQVPDLKGRTQAEAKEALKQVGLVGTADDPEETTEVNPGLVFKQSIAAGVMVIEGSKVTFTVAVAPSESTVPNVVGMASADAKKALTDASLGNDVTTAYNDSVPEDKVIEQSIAAGQQVKSGTTVTICISLGAKPVLQVSVPDVMGYSWSDACNAMQSAGLAVRYTGDPAGKVVDQDIDAGTQVDPNTLVTLTLKTPTPLVEVPDLVGMSVTSAEEATDDLGLALDATSLHGTVVSQEPAPGTQVEERTTVHVTVDDSDFRDDNENADDRDNGTTNDNANDDNGNTNKVFNNGNENTDDNDKANSADNDDDGDANDNADNGSEFIGSWDADRAHLEIQNVGSGFNVQISWGSSAFETTTWSYVCSYKDGQLVSNGKGTKVTTDYSDEDDEGEATTEYTNGKATFSLSNGKLTWNDQTENAGSGLSFTQN